MNRPLDTSLRLPFATSSRRPAPDLPAATRTVLELLRHLQGGALRIELADGSALTLGDSATCCSMQVTDSAVFNRILAEGDIGFAETYIDGQWHTDNLPALLTLLAQNRETLARALHGQLWSVLSHRLRHLLRANTRSGSRRNILAHYDLGNDFYRAWLDPSMTYSAGVFGTVTANESGALTQAQQHKYLRILDGIAPSPGDLILEVGCGWGGFAELAVTRYGCRVHGITLSPAQLEYAQARARAGGWADRVHFELRDYRDIEGRYDHVVSIEMIEAVGERWWPRYFRILRQAVKPTGRVMLQAITIADAHFARYRRGTDFIQRHIFPGGMLPSPAIITREARNAGFDLLDRFDFGGDYATTLAHWHDRFEAAWPHIATLGFDERFRRLWRFYLAYCEAGFRAGSTDVHHVLLAPQR